MFVRVRSFCLLTALVAAAASGLTGANPLEGGADRKIAGRAIARTKFGSVPYGASITRCTVPGKIALTFDDGPCEFTGQVLDTLEANGAKGTFFVVGASGDAGIASGKYTSVLKRMVSNGHQVASHSYSHADFETLSQEGKIAELTKLEDAFISTLGYIPTYFRPPYTSCGSQCYAALGEMGYHVTDYDLDPKDFENGGAASKDIFTSAVSGSSPSGQSFIVLSHDIQPFTVNGFVQWMIDLGKQRGFQFTTLGECLGDPPANWYRDPSTGGPLGGAPEPTKTTSTSTTSSALPSSTSTTSSVVTTSAAPTTTSVEVTPPIGIGQQSATRAPEPTSSKPATTTKNAAVAVSGGAGTSLLASLMGAIACILMF